MILLLIIPVVILVYYYYKNSVPALSKNRKTLLMVLRNITIIILLMLLFNPIISYFRNVSYYPEVVYLMDDSYSMDLRAGEQTKKDLFDEYFQSLSSYTQRSNYETRQFNFAAGIEGSRTTANLSQTLQNLTERVDLSNVEKVFLLSDGWFSDDQLDVISRFNIPIWTIHPDYEPEEYDVGINRLLYNQVVYTEDEIPIIADVYADNYQGEAAVKLYIDDELFDRKDVDFTDESMQQVIFNKTFSEAGLVPIRVEIEPLDIDDELMSLANNIHPGAIRVQDKRSGTYVLSDKLLWDVRFVNNAFRKDERKDVEVFISRDNRIYMGREVVEPQDVFVEHLQLIVIINHGDLNLSGDILTLLERFVGNGGGLLYIGKPIETLNEMLAATDVGIDRTFRTTISLTSESNKYQTFNNIDAAKIPPIDHYYVSSMLQAEVLARFNNDEQSPAIILNEYRQGRVLYLPLLNIWRWQLRGEDNQYNSFIDNLASWLANPAGVDFFAQSDKNSYYLGERVSISLTALDETLTVHPNLNPKLRLFDDDENIVTEEFLHFDGQKYSIELSQLGDGEYNYEIVEETIDKTAAGSFFVSDISAEGRHRGYNYPLLSFISRQTGGQIMRDDDIDNYSIDNADLKSDRVRFEIPIYRNWFVITMFLLAFCLEIFFRKRWGLL